MNKLLLINNIVLLVLLVTSFILISIGLSNEFYDRTEIKTIIKEIPVDRVINNTVYDTILIEKTINNTIIKNNNVVRYPESMGECIKISNTKGYTLHCEMK